MKTSDDSIERFHGPYGHHTKEKQSRAFRLLSLVETEEVIHRGDYERVYFNGYVIVETKEVYTLLRRAVNPGETTRLRNELGEPLYRRSQTHSFRP